MKHSGSTRAVASLATSASVSDAKTPEPRDDAYTPGTRNGADIMSASRTLVPTVLAILLAASVTACADDRGDTLTLPQIKPSREAVDAYAQMFVISRVLVSEGEVCPFVIHNEQETLFVLPSGAEVSGAPPEITYSGVTFAEGDTIMVGASSEITGGYECGGMDWEHALRLRGEAPSITRVGE